MKSKGLIGAFVIVLVAAGVGAGLYFGGVLPVGANNESAEGGAAADSLATAENDSDNNSKDDNDEPVVMPTPVELALVEGRGIAAYYRAASVIEANRLVETVAKTTGRVSVINVEEGDWVAEGQILAEMENDRERIMLRKAELTVADKTRQVTRSRTMNEEELISRQELDDQESALEMAEAERDLAAIALEETRLRASFAGQITERKVVPGQQLGIAAPAFTIADFSPLRVRVHLPESVARKINQGQRVLVSTEASERPLIAEVERISPVVDPATSTVRVTLQLDGEGDAARVGGFVKVRITTEEHHDALSIPKTALVEEGALRNVFVAEADTVRKVEIETGLYDETHVEVVDGLFAGDHVVAMGQGGLRTGSLIKALNADDVKYVGVQEDEDGDLAEGAEAVTVMANKDSK
ncbi:MAG: membrane fusion protein (multidrug efflux system) [Candidatus Krumholzibacteriia bacterium]|jgi:membrane fusion protein (multidrug efflux system)